MKRMMFAAALAARLVLAMAMVGCAGFGNFAAAADKAPLANYSGSALTLKTGDTVPVANGGTGGTTASAARTNLGLGDLATQNAATPPALGGTTPAAGSFSSLKDTGISGVTQCIHADSSGNFTGTGSDCSSGGFADYFAQIASGSVNFKNNPAPSAIIQPVTVTIPGSSSARTFLVTLYYSTASGGGTQPSVEIILDSTTNPVGQNRLQPPIDGNYGFGFSGGYSGYVTIPGDSASHVIGLGCAQLGGGSGFTVTTAAAQIIAQQIG